MKHIQLRQSTLKMLKCRDGEWKDVLWLVSCENPHLPNTSTLDNKATGLTKYVDKPGLFTMYNGLQWGAARKGLTPIQLVPLTTR